MKKKPKVKVTGKITNQLSLSNKLKAALQNKSIKEILILQRKSKSYTTVGKSKMILHRIKKKIIT